MWDCVHSVDGVCVSVHACAKVELCFSKIALLSLCLTLLQTVDALG